MSSRPWRVVFTRRARKDARKLARSGLRPNAEKLLALLREDPFRSPPRFEKLVGDLSGAFSRRIGRPPATIGEATTCTEVGDRLHSSAPLSGS